MYNKLLNIKSVVLCFWVSAASMEQLHVYVFEIILVLCYVYIFRVIVLQHFAEL